ncbi:MAG: sodium:solute symporter family protein [Lautropia sp.]|nr:sodium:solute symporter family protein [Lautropia sp.]
MSTPSLISTSSAIFWLVLFASAFSLAGLLYARRSRDNLEDFITARNTQGPFATFLTLLASSLGAWILLSPPESATWGGTAAIIGYALGSMSPIIALMLLGQRMRQLMPRGHSLTEFLMARYGRPMYLLTLIIMVFYIFIAMTAEITAIAMLMTLLAPVPLWLTAIIVMGSVLLYTMYGGLRASIFTDKVQVIIIVPLIVALALIGWQITGGIMPVVDSLDTKAPQLLNLSDPVGVKAGLTFFVAILLTGIFHQGNWQRIYAARSTRDMRRGFLLGGMLVIPFILLMGAFGLAYVAMEPGGEPSVALFSLIMPNVPTWVAIGLIPLGLALVMGSSDTAVSAVSSIIAVEGSRVMPDASPAQLLRLARWLVALLAIPVVLVASQGYSVLYLFLLADLLCAAAAFPVFFGMYNRRHDGFDATVATLAGLCAGLAVFPLPDQPLDHLLESFLLAALVPVVVVGLLQLLRSQESRSLFGLQGLAGQVRHFEAPAPDAEGAAPGAATQPGTTDDESAPKNQSK